MPQTVTTRQKLFILVTLLYALGMFGWLLWDGVVQVARVSHLPFNEFRVEPIVWHKLGEPLIALPIVIFAAGGYMLWSDNARTFYIRWVAPLTIIGGLSEWVAVGLFFQRGRTDFIFWFSLLLGLVGVVAPRVLHRLHLKVRQP